MMRPSSMWLARAMWPSRIFGPCVTSAMSFTRSAVPVWVFRTVCSMSLHAAEEPERADVHLLHALFHKTAAGVDAVVGQLLLNLPDGEPIGDEFVGSMRIWYSRSVPPKSETSTTSGIDLNCLSSTQSSIERNSIRS